MLALNSTDPLAVQVTQSIRSGGVEALKQLLADNPELATARILTPLDAAQRSEAADVVQWLESRGAR